MKSVEFSYRSLRAAAFGFLLLPVLLFLLFSVKLLFSIPVALCLIAVYLFAVKEPNGADEDQRKVAIPAKLFWILLGLCALWCYLGGQGGLFFQTSDWNERNAIFRDLISTSWPVYYPVTDTVMTYYIGHWLPAAALARGLFFLTGNLEISFAVGNVLLALWTLTGVMITLFLHLYTINPKTKKGMWLVFALFVGFSGMDIIGCMLKRWSFANYFDFLHLEWWAGHSQLSSNTTCLFWVFNQAITAWIATLLFANEKSNRNYVFIVSTSLLSATLPCVGLAILMVGKAGFELAKRIRRGTWKPYLKATFGFSNLVTLFTWVPVICLYLISNSAFENTGAKEAADGWVMPLRMILVVILVGIVGVAIGVWWWHLRRTGKVKSPFLLGCALLLLAMSLFLARSRYMAFGYFAVMVLEFGIHWLLLAKNYQRDPMFYMIAFLLIIGPCIRVGISADFCMRATIPALTLLMVICGRKLVSYFERDPEKKVDLWEKRCCTALVVILLIGALTPAMEIYRGFQKTVVGGKLVQPADQIETLNKYHSSGGIYGNFVSENYDHSLFFQYLAQD
ncbi:MAG: hypothetical protein IKD18_01390 [Clostridia bacterium]|nr:hypothetical protein [Clostridia bacterium]